MPPPVAATKNDSPASPQQYLTAVRSSLKTTPQIPLTDPQSDIRFLQHPLVFNTELTLDEVNEYISGNQDIRTQAQTAWLPLVLELQIENFAETLSSLSAHLEAISSDPQLAVSAQLSENQLVHLVNTFQIELSLTKQAVFSSAEAYEQKRTAETPPSQVCFDCKLRAPVRGSGIATLFSRSMVFAGQTMFGRDFTLAIPFSTITEIKAHQSAHRLNTRISIKTQSNFYLIAIDSQSVGHFIATLSAISDTKTLVSLVESAEHTTSSEDPLKPPESPSKMGIDRDQVVRQLLAYRAAVSAYSALELNLNERTRQASDLVSPVSSLRAVPIASPAASSQSLVETRSNQLLKLHNSALKQKPFYMSGGGKSSQRSSSIPPQSSPPSASPPSSESPPASSGGSELSLIAPTRSRGIRHLDLYVEIDARVDFPLARLQVSVTSIYELQLELQQKFKLQFFPSIRALEISQAFSRTRSAQCVSSLDEIPDSAFILISAPARLMTPSDIGVFFKMFIAMNSENVIAGSSAINCIVAMQINNIASREDAAVLVHEMISSGTLIPHHAPTKSRKLSNIDSPYVLFNVDTRRSVYRPQPLMIQSIYFCGNGISLPKMIPVLFTMKKVVCGNTHCCAISDESRLWVWGTKFHLSSLFFFSSFFQF